MDKKHKVILITISRFVMAAEVLVLGPSGSGKTLLLDRFRQVLQSYDNVDIYSKSSTTIPTIGVDVVSFRIHDRDIQVREVGSAMASQWTNYMKYCSAIVYVIDVSDPISVARSMMLLLEIIGSNDTQGKPLAVALNKTDLVADGMFGILQYEESIKLNIILKEREDKNLDDKYSNLADCRTVKLYGSSLDLSLAIKLNDWIMAIAKGWTERSFRYSGSCSS